MIQDIESAFSHLGLNQYILRALLDIGYVEPSLIQKECIPHLLKGYDVLGLAETGSGKTAAFILPLLQNIDPSLCAPQLLILAPTRELAMQLGDVSLNFSKYIQGIRVISLYGGQKYSIQLRALHRGTQIVVGTPGRLLDHLRRNTLDLSKLQSLVIDEADEMLRMGFIEDVKKIILNIPKKCQISLFSATLPKAIRRIAFHFMKSPKEVYIGTGTQVSNNIRQNYCIVSSLEQKKEALMRFLEVEDYDAAIVFVRTKGTTLELSGMLENDGYNSSALNGDMNQLIRQKTIECLKNGHLDILIATDVAARGLDLDRITLVINYDMPTDFDSYIHRIGRTGRAGRLGRSLSFVQMSECRLLRHIERSINFNIFKVKVPTSQVLSSNRLSKFIIKIQNYLDNSKDLDKYRILLSTIKLEKKLDIEDLAAVLLKIAQGKRPLVISSYVDLNKSLSRVHHKKGINRNYNHKYMLSDRYKKSLHVLKINKRNDMDLYRINIGRKDGVEAHHIFRAISSKGNINNQYIGCIKLFASYSLIELSKSIQNHILSNIDHMRILNKSVDIQLLNSSFAHQKNCRHKLIDRKNSHSYIAR